MKTKTFDKKAYDLADKVIEAAKAGDRAAHWKAVYALLRHQNKKARKEQDKIAEEAASVRKDKMFKKTKSKHMGLRFGVAMPPLTYAALVEADTLAYGKSDLRETDKESLPDKNSTNSIVKDLEKAFPQYRVS